MGLFSIFDSFLFPAPKPSSYRASDLCRQLIWIPANTRPGSRRVYPPTPCLFLQHPSANKMLIYLHGNAEDIGLASPFLQDLRDELGMHVLGVEYPGYGVYEGTACEKSVNAAVEAVYTYIINVLGWPAQDLYVFGRSIGTGPATLLASKQTIGGLVLMSAYTSIRDVASVLVGRFVAAMFADRFVNRDAIPRVTCPTLLIHGKQDTLIPWSHSEHLYHACGASSKHAHFGEMMDHNMFDIRHDIIQPVKTFFNFRRGSPRTLNIPPELYVAPSTSTSFSSQSTSFSARLVDAVYAANAPDASRENSRATTNTHPR
eukprot:GILK01004984.1.p1 GENE.GILK01004984.1~~GILK01004984.1.p1  ORF type:complete len:316 (-),score=21.88 GILK01004984.1:178-1125(-)